MILISILMAGLAVSAMAEEAVEELSKETVVTEMVAEKVEEKPAAVEENPVEAVQKPAEKPVVKALEKPVENAAEPAAKPVEVASCEVVDAEDPLKGCAAHLVKVSKGYERALKEWKAFALSASRRLENVAARETKMKGDIQAKSTEITKLRLESSRKNKNRLKQLERENKQLWKDLKAIVKEQAGLCKNLAKQGAKKQSELSANISARWKSARSSLR